MRVVMRATLVGLILLLTGPVVIQAQDTDTYTVQANDRLAHIAWRFGLLVDELASLNGIVNPDRLEADQVLQLPPETYPVFTGDQPAFVLSHVMQRGESLYRLALHYGLRVDDLVRYNEIDNPNLVEPGQTVTVILFGAGEADIDASFEPLPTIYDRLDPEHSTYNLLLRHNALIPGVWLYNGWGIVPIPEAPVVIPPAAQLGLPDTDRVAEAPIPTPTSSPDPTSTPEAAPPTAVPTTPPEPTAVSNTPEPVPTNTPTDTSATTSGEVAVSFGGPYYQADGRFALVDVNLTNISVSPAIDGGLHYFELNPDGGLQFVTLLGVRHDDLPVALAGNAPLWKAIVTFTDGEVWEFYAGCQYLETIYAQGFEPTGPDTGFIWEAEYKGGWYDCGNGYKVKPEDIPPGGSATVPLWVYMQHPREWLYAAPPTRRIARIDLGVWRSDGMWMGIVGSVTY